MGYIRTVVYYLLLYTNPGMQTNVNPDRTPSKGAVRSGFIFLAIWATSEQLFNNYSCSTYPGMQTNVNPDRAVSEGAVRFGLTLHIRLCKRV